MKILLLLILFVPLVPAFANIGFQPVYQPNLPSSGQSPETLYCTLGDFLNSYNSTTNTFTCGTPSGGISDGDKGDITVSNSGATWEINADTIVNNDISNGAAINPTKIGDGSVDATEWGYLGTISSNVQTQLDSKEPALPSKTGNSLKYLRVNLLENGLEWNTIAAVAGITSINGETGAAQTLAGSSGNITVTTTTNTNTFNIGSNVVILNGVQTLTNKIMSGASNTFSNIAKSAISATGTWAESDIPTLAKSKISTTGTWVAADIPSLDTSKITTGTMDTARLGSGSASSSTFLRGDQTWATPSGGGPTVLGSDVTCTATASYCTIWTIPLTPSSGNTIDGVLSADSNTSGVAIQLRVRSDDTGLLGWCNFISPSTATASVISNLVISTTSADTGWTVWLPAVNVPQTLQFRCAGEADATSPQNLIVEMQMETAGTGTIQKGSHYIKTP